MDAMQFEPMSVGRIFDRTFMLYRNNFLRFVTIVAIIEVPLTLIVIASDSWVRTQMSVRQGATVGAPAVSQKTSPAAERYDPAGEPSLLFGCLGTALPILLQIVSVMLCQAVLIKNVSETYLGNEITIGQAYRFIVPKAWTLIAASICTTLATWFGLILFVVPGIIFGLWFSLTMSVIVVEGCSATGGMSRSKALVGGNLGKTFAVGLLAGLIAYIVTIPLGLGANFLGTILFAENLALRSFVIHFTSTISQILVTPIGAAAYILLYYDLRIRKEGFDLQMLAQSMVSNQGPNGVLRLPENA